MNLKEHENLIASGAMGAGTHRWSSSAIVFFGLSPFKSATKIMLRGGYQFAVNVEQSGGGDNPGRHK